MTPQPAKTCGERFEASSGFFRPARCAGRLHVAGDLRDQVPLALVRLLVAEPLPELDDEAPPVEVAVEVEQECLDTALVAPVVRVDADRDCGAVAAGPDEA